MERIERNQRYVAPGVPRSPLVLAVAWAVVAAVAAAATYLDVEIDLDLESVLTVVAAMASAIGYSQHSAARREQAAGVPELERARAELPPGAVPANSQDAGEILADDGTPVG